MKASLKPGLTHRLLFRVPEDKTVPYLYPESPDFSEMPKVFATGFMVGLFEWACIELLKDHLDPGEGSLGVSVAFDHVAATPPGLTVTVDAECTAVEGRRVSFHVRGHDGIDLIGQGRHQRMIVSWDIFAERVASKAKTAGVLAG
ncbi:MAG: thioesterase family protein [Methylovirgula sp.]